MKIRKPSELDDDEEEDSQVQICVGDLIIGSKKSNLNNCKKIAVEMLKNKTISAYLDSYKYKKLITPSSIG